MTADNNYSQASTSLLLALAVVCLARYAVFMFSPGNVGHPVAYTLILIAEIIGMTQFLGIWLTIIIGKRPNDSLQVQEMKRDLRVHGASMQKLPFSIAAFITVAGEELETVKETIIAVRNMHVPHRTVVLDDGESDDVKRLTEMLGVEYIRRGTREGRKAGNVNNGLKHVKTDYVAIFDADHVPSKDFLVETIPYLEADSLLAYVQTPQHFENRDTFVCAGTAEAQEAFYRHIQPGKNAFNAAYCVGTNVLFRRKALDELGGMHQKSNSEDIWTSILLHEKGWKSYFHAKILAIGRAPDTVASYFVQQTRWARGGLEIFFHHNPLLQRSLSLDQKIQYFHASSHYLIGVAMCIFYILPLLWVYLGWKPFQTGSDPFAWALVAVPYLGMIILSTVHLMGKWNIWRSFVVTVSAFPSHMTAMLSVLTGFSLNWSVTGVIRRRVDYISSVAPHIFLFLLSVGAIPLALLSLEQDGYLVAGWLVWNCVVLFSICKLAIPKFNTVSVQSPISTLKYAS